MKQGLLIILSVCTLQMYGQLNPVLKNKRGILILPQEGEFAIGFSANPILTYMGNLVNGNTFNPSPQPAFAAADKMIFGKYMKTNQMAYRASFRIGVNRNKQTFEVKDLTPGAAVDATVQDEQIRSSTFIGFAAGFEKRRGATRLQGFYGGEAVFQYRTGENIKYNYGNEIEKIGPNVLRATQVQSRAGFSAGVRGFAGVEYFVAPRVSLAAEFGYALTVGSWGESVETRESYDAVQQKAVENKTELSPKATVINLDSDNYNGIIRLCFYF